MQTKSLLLLVALATSCSLAVSAQTAEVPAPAASETPTWSTTITPAVVSQYMFRGVRLGGPAFQPSIEFGRGNLALGIWASTPLKDKVPGQSDPEIDPYGSYKFVINDTLSIQPGFTWYTYPKADKSVGFYKSTFEPSVAVNYTAGAVTLTPKVYYDMMMKGPTFELNASTAIPLKELGTEIDLAASVGTFKWNDAFSIHNPDTKNYGDYWQAGVSVPYTIGKAKLSVGWAYAKGSNNYVKTGTDPKQVNPAAVGRGVVTVSCAWAF